MFEFNIKLKKHVLYKHMFIRHRYFITKFINKNLMTKSRFLFNI